jgi:hypothetical protein
MGKRVRETINRRGFVEVLCQFPLDARRRFLRKTLERLFPRNFEVEVTGNTGISREWDDQEFELDSKLAAELVAGGLFPGEEYQAPRVPQHTANFVLRFGKNPERLLVGCHYDVVETTPGANDNAAAVAQVVEAALEIQRKFGVGPGAPDVTFVFFDFEEDFDADHMGSKTYVRRHADSLPELAAILDVTGIGEIYYSQDQTSQGTAEKWVPGMSTRTTPPSDNIAFEGRTEYILFCALPPKEMDAKKNRFPKTWRSLHHPEDTPNKLWDSSLEAGTQVVLDLIMKFNGLRRGR